MFIVFFEYGNQDPGGRTGGSLDAMMDRYDHIALNMHTKRS